MPHNANDATQLNPVRRSVSELDDGSWLARVKAPPVDGKANAAVIALVAKHFGLRKAQVHIKSGARPPNSCWRTTVITLYTFGPFFGLPDASPFVMKGEMLLKLAGIPYQTNTTGFMRAPKGKLPYIDDDGTIVADSTLIRLHLEKKYGIDFDRALSARDRGIAWAVEKMLEDHLYWVLVYWRWMNDANFDKGPANFFKRAPALIRPLVVGRCAEGARATCTRHGIGRHNEAEMNAMADRASMRCRRCWATTSTSWATEPAVPMPRRSRSSPARCRRAVRVAGARQSCERVPNLVAYRDRMMAEFFPTFVQVNWGQTPLLAKGVRASMEGHEALQFVAVAAAARCRSRSRRGPTDRLRTRAPHSCR